MNRLIFIGGLLSLALLYSCSGPTNLLVASGGENVRSAGEGIELTSEEVVALHLPQEPVADPSLDAKSPARAMAILEPMGADFNNPDSLAAIDDDAVFGATQYRHYSGSHRFQNVVRALDAESFQLPPEDPNAVVVDWDKFGTRKNGVLTNVSRGRFWPRTIENAYPETGITFEVTDLTKAQSVPVNMKSIKVVSGTILLRAYRTDVGKWMSWTFDSADGPTTYQFTTFRSKHVKDVEIYEVNKKGYYKVDDITFEVAW